MNDKVLELVVYKIKPEQIQSYQDKTLNQFRELVKSFQGVLSYQTFHSVKEDGLFVDQVEWENLECAEFAAHKVKQVQKDETFGHYLSAFEEIQMFHHFKKVAES